MLEFQKDFSEIEFYFKCIYQEFYLSTRMIKISQISVLTRLVKPTPCKAKLSHTNGCQLAAVFNFHQILGFIWPSQQGSKREDTPQFQANFPQR